MPKMPPLHASASSSCVAANKQHAPQFEVRYMSHARCENCQVPWHCSGSLPCFPSWCSQCSLSRSASNMLPFTLPSEPTGETWWVRKMIDQYHDAAAAAGVRIVPCCGYDSIPSDLGTWFAVEHVKRTMNKCVPAASIRDESGLSRSCEARTLLPGLTPAVRKAVSWESTSASCDSKFCRCFPPRSKRPTREHVDRRAPALADRRRRCACWRPSKAVLWAAVQSTRCWASRTCPRRSGALRRTPTASTPPAHGAHPLVGLRSGPSIWFSMLRGRLAMHKATCVQVAGVSRCCHLSTHPPYALRSLRCVLPVQRGP